MNRNVVVLARGAKLPITITVLGLALFASIAKPQTGATQPPTLTLERSIEYALAHYPAVRVAVERQAAASAEVGVAKTSYLPRADLLWQGNRATHNNVFSFLRTLFRQYPARYCQRARAATLGTARQDYSFPGSRWTSAIARRS